MTTDPCAPCVEGRHEACVGLPCQCRARCFRMPPRPADGFPGYGAMVCGERCLKTAKALIGDVSNRRKYGSDPSDFGDTDEQPFSTVDVLCIVTGHHEQHVAPHPTKAQTIKWTEKRA